MDLGAQSNLDMLNHYLQQHVAGFSGLRTAEKFSDGQSNPTYLLKAESGQYVLRMQPSGALLKSAHAVDREYRVMHALTSTHVPVPKMLHLCVDKTMLGTLFFVMAYVDGRVLWNPALPDFSIHSRTQLYDNMNRVLADLHNVDVNKVGLADFGKPGNYYRRQLERWSKQYDLTRTENLTDMTNLIAWLNDNVPDDDGQVSLIHGDFRLDNLMFSAETEHVLSVLDWELSTLGHPFADLAYQCMQWRLANDAVVPGLASSNREALGIPTEQAYVERYCERRGLSGIANWSFYLAFSFFRFAAIVQGVFKRSIDGNASSSKATAYGELTPVLSRLGLQTTREPGLF